MISIEFEDVLTAQPKPQTWENEKYLQWVRSQPCACCGMPADDAHHIIGAGLGGTMGRKAHDLMVMPLCRLHHSELHHGVGEWEKKHGSQMFYVLRTQNRALSAGVLS